MANEITSNMTLKVVNGITVTSTLNNSSITQATAGAVQRRQSIPTSDTVITLTGVTTPGWCTIKNTDATNYVEVGPTSGGAIVKCMQIKAGEQAQFRIAGSVVLRAIANTGACIIEVTILET